MKVSLDWLPALRLKDEGHGYASSLLANVPDTGGIYVFARKHGKRVTPIYVGKAENLKSRIKQQLNNLKLISSVKNWGAQDGFPPLTGARLLYLGCLQARPGRQNIKAQLELAEKAVIEHALAEGHPIINIKGTQIRHHAIESTGAGPTDGLVPENILRRWA